MSARLVNHTWREASLAMKFVDQEALVLWRPRSDNLNQVMDILQHSTRPFYHFIFREVELKRNMPIWDQYGPHMKRLVLVQSIGFLRYGRSGLGDPSFFLNDHLLIFSCAAI